jgi:hypothetical protein
MAGSWRLLATAVVITTLVASTADAFGFRFGLGAGSMRSSSYSAAPIYYYYCPPGPTIVPVPDAHPKLAIPTPAPPSGTVEPSLGSTDPRLPKIITRSADAELAKDRCRVGFWNLTGRDVVVTIEGKTMPLAKNQALRFDLNRQFSWQMAGRSQIVERVPVGENVYEVIIRE